MCNSGERFGFFASLTETLKLRLRRDMPVMLEQVYQHVRGGEAQVYLVVHQQSQMFSLNLLD